MHWLQSVDTGLFRFINETSANPFFDKLMPFLSGNQIFFPALVIALVLLLWKGTPRARLCAVLTILIVAFGDGVICNLLKEWIARPRPFHDIADANLRVGRGRSFSMPSAHAMNWFCATAIFFLYHRRTLFFMLPLAIGVSLSRVYVGVHYPSDVLAGAILGAGYGIASIIVLNFFWKAVGKTFFPLWWQQCPSLLECGMRTPGGNTEKSASAIAFQLDRQWLRLGYIVIGVLLLARLSYIAGDTIELSEDEAYYWLWSKHPALSYFSKPPLIAYTHWLGTRLWGDTAFGVRFFSPVIAAILSVMLLRFITNVVSARVAFVLLLIISATPLLAVGATLMTIDPLSVLFWTAAMLAGWRAVQENSKTRDWLWVGLWMGLGFLSKYTALLQFLCWAVFFASWPPARRHLRRPGPFLAIGIFLVCALPVLIWNAQHDWITVSHVGTNAKLDKTWHPTLKHFVSFLGQEFALLNPVFFVGALGAAIAFWRHFRRDALLIFLFSMGAPVFIGYLAYTLHSAVLANWIAPSIVPLFCLMTIYWARRWERNGLRIKPWLKAGVTIGIVFVVFLHDTDLIQKVSGRALPPAMDPLRRVRGWKKTADTVRVARTQLVSEGKPVFIIGQHYGIASQIAFHLAEAKSGLPAERLVYVRSSTRPKNQFFFWPDYHARRGENALFVREVGGPDSQQRPPPQEVVEQFDTVSEIGIYDVTYRKRILRRIQIFACRGLR